MSLRLRNKFITAIMALVVSLALVAAFAAVDALAPKASLLGFIIRASVLAGIVPVALIGFNALCDKCTLPSDRRGSDESATHLATVRKNNLIHNGQHQNEKAPDRGAAIIAGRDETMLAFIPVYHSTRFSVVPKEKWWIGQ